MANEAEKTLHEMQQVLTIDANGVYETEEDKAELLWHELQNAYRSKRILSGVLSGVEETSSGSIAVVYYKGQRMIIPVSEMELNLSEQNGYGEMKGRQVRILNNMVGCEIDFILIALDDTARSVVASRDWQCLQNAGSSISRMKTATPRLPKAELCRRVLSQ